MAASVRSGASWMEAPPQRCMHARALVPRGSFSIRILCLGKVFIYTHKRRVAKIRTGVEDLVTFSQCTHTQFDGKRFVEAV